MIEISKIVTPGGTLSCHFSEEDMVRIKEAVQDRILAIVGLSPKTVLSLQYRTIDNLADLFSREMRGDRLRRVLTGTSQGRTRWSEILRLAVEAWKTNLPPTGINWRDYVPPMMTARERRKYEKKVLRNPEAVVVWYPRPGAAEPRVRGSLRDRRAINVWSTKLAWSYVTIPPAVAAWVTAELLQSEYGVRWGAGGRELLMDDLTRIFLRNPIDDIFRRAKEAPRILQDLAKIEAVHDPDGSLKDAIGIMGSAFQRAAVFKKEEERTSGELAGAFPPGDDLGDALIFAAKGTEEAFRRYEMRHPFPIFRLRWRKEFRDFEDEIGSRMLSARMSRERVLRDVRRAAFFEAARILSIGWPEAKPRGKAGREGKPPRKALRPTLREIDIGGVVMRLREVQPVQFEDLLGNRDPSVWANRMLEVGIEGCGAYSFPLDGPDDVSAFIREMHFSVSELTVLLVAIRAYALEIIHRRKDAVAALKHQYGKSAIADLRNKTVAAIEREIACDIAEEILTEEGRELHIYQPDTAAEILAGQLENLILTPGQRDYVEVRRRAKNDKEAAEILGISHAAARKRKSRLKEKASRKS